jgi:AcrR family transcriptional regulator
MRPQRGFEVNNLPYSSSSGEIGAVTVAPTAIRAPRQARSRATWARVLDAGMELLEEGGYPALTVDAICARAGATPPSGYARAGSKEGLLLAIYEHAVARIDATGIDPDDPAWAGLTPEDAIRRAVDAVCRGWLDHAGLLRPIVGRAAHDAEVFRRGSETSRQLGAGFRTVLAGAGVSERDADACFRLVYAALVQRVMYGEGFESDVPLADDTLEAMLAEAAVRYVRG